MAKKKNITQDQIIEWYMNDVLTDTDVLKSVFSFAQSHQFDETKFYEFFSGFQHLDKVIFKIFGQKTLEILSEDMEYSRGDARHKTLSFYFTFFELLTANRSFVVQKLKSNANKLESLMCLKELRMVFIDFIQGLDVQKMDLKNETLTKIQTTSYQESAWVQFLFCLQFWLNDESPRFEKTDLFIEKSVRAAFDLTETTPLNSVLDFAKFIYQEKFSR
ncbi:MAG: TetR family transcriptional regulator C-terminal domain-containing protein [Flavobacteriales bacterium]